MQSKSQHDLICNYCINQFEMLNSDFVVNVIIILFLLVFVLSFNSLHYYFLLATQFALCVDDSPSSSTVPVHCNPCSTMQKSFGEVFLTLAFC